MKKMCTNVILAGCAGLAISATAQAQLAIVNNQPGAWVNGVDVAANLIAGSQGDDTNNAVTIPAAYSNEVLTSGACQVSSNGMLLAAPGSAAYNNLALSAAGPFGYYPCWDDLYCAHQTGATPPSGIYAMDTGTMFVVQWNFDAFSSANTGVPGNAFPYAKMQVQIRPTGSAIRAQYLYLNLNTNTGTMTGQSATIGAVSQTGAQVMQYSLNTANSIGDNVILSIVPDATGACCLADGTCSTGTASACTGSGGVFQGAGSVCGACPQPGACCIPSTLSCSFIAQPQCTAAAGNFAGVGVTCAAANCPSPGACCAPDGSCTQSLPAACATAQGVYRGDSTSCATANCPQPGACCKGDGTCAVLGAGQCAALVGSTFQGSGTVCGTCVQPFLETGGDSGDLPATAEVVTGSGRVVGIQGTLGTGDADMYSIQICDAANFRATTVGASTVDTQLMLFKADGTGVTFNDDTLNSGTLQSTITSQFVAPLGNGQYYIAVSQYPKRPNSAGGAIWLDGTFTNESQPDGPGAASPVTGWDAGTGTGGAYTILLNGVCVPPVAACYANCDSSTTIPCLNVLDFSCFLNAFAAGASYANCDASTTIPVLNVLDFSCFLNKFAAGCSSC